MHKFLMYPSIDFCLTCFGLSFSPFSEEGVQFRQWFKFPGYDVSARALTRYPGDLNHCRNCTPASEDGLKESPKHVRQKRIDGYIKNLCITLVIIQFHFKMHGPYNIKLGIVINYLFSRTLWKHTRLKFSHFVTYT
jgi:hypothetical protein